MTFAAYLAFLFACAPDKHSVQDQKPESSDKTESADIEEEAAMPQPEPRSVREVPRPRIRARHILIAHSMAAAADPELDRTKEQAKAIADNLLLQIKSGSEFDKLAREHSDDASRKRGGDLGVFTKGIMHQTFEETVLALNIGQHSEVIETPFGFHLIERLPVIEVHVDHILVQWADLKRTVSERSREEAVLIAQQALAELHAGKPFPKVAKKFSDGPFGSRGGNLGWFQKGQMVPQFDDIAFALQPGEISEIVESAHGFHIIRRIE